MSAQSPPTYFDTHPEVGAWERWGQTDPMWAIVSRPGMEGGRWKADDFFETGEQRIQEIFRRVPELSALPSEGRALDFGCGVGRLTQALATRFRETVGVDAAPSMIREANRLNGRGDRVRYVVNDSDDLAQFPTSSFDFVLADIVLQHIRPRRAYRFLTEFVRILRPGGRLVFQAPARPTSLWLRWIPAALSDPAFNLSRNLLRRVRASKIPGWESHWISIGTARRTIERARGTVLAVLDEPPIHGRLENHLYVARRAASGGSGVV